MGCIFLASLWVKILLLIFKTQRLSPYPPHIIPTCLSVLLRGEGGIKIVWWSSNQVWRRDRGASFQISRWGKGGEDEEEVGQPGLSQKRKTPRAADGRDEEKGEVHCTEKRR